MTGKMKKQFNIRTVPVEAHKDLKDYAKMRGLPQGIALGEAVKIAISWDQFMRTVGGIAEGAIIAEQGHGK